MTFKIEEEKYLTYKENFKQVKRRYKTVIQTQKRNLNKMFKSENKIKFRILDILAIFFLLFNIGALIITNMMVVKINPDMQFHEANPITADNYNFVKSPDAKPFMTGFILNVISWTYMIGWYLYNRLYIHTHSEFYIFIGSFIYLGVALSLDFFNDFGYLLGKIIWG